MPANRICSILTVTAAILTAGLLAQGFLETLTDPPLVNAATSKAQPNRTPPPQTAPDYKTPLAEQRMAGGYWRVDHTFEPILVITNFLANVELPVTPILYAADGTEYQLAIVTLAPGGVSSVDIRAALSTAPEELKGHFSEYGSAAVKYVWHWAGAASAMIQNRDPKRSLNFNFELQSAAMIMPQDSPLAVREGLWWREDTGVKAVLAVINVAQHPIDVQTQVLSGVGALRREWTVHLDSNQRRSLDLLLDSDGSSGGVRVIYKGAQKDVALAGVLENPHEGYSAQIPFLTVSPDKQPSAVAVSSVGLLLGAPDPTMNFPAGTQFGIYLALRNTSTSPVSANTNKQEFHVYTWKPLVILGGLMRYAKKTNRILALIPPFFLTLCSICYAQNTRDREASEKIATRIEAIVHRAAVPLELSDPSAPIQISSSQIFFEPEDIAEVQGYGSQVVPVLAKFLLNKNTRVERVAIRLLGVIGGPTVTDPLLEVLEKSTSALSRTEALLNLKQTSCTKAVARAILRAAKTDADAKVREQAREELSWCRDETH